MSDTVIKVENLSKQYRIGAREAGYRTFRETLVDAAKAPFQRLGAAWSIAHKAWGRKHGAESKEQSVKKRYKARVVRGEVAEDLFNRGLCLPSGTAMTDEDLDSVVGVIRMLHRN